MRIVHLSDTHLGAAPMGFQQQRGYPERLPELLAALREWIAEDGGVDAVIHGGDCIDATSPERVAQARELLAPLAPVRLCLGNHDLTTTDALATWLAGAPELFAGGSPQSTLVADGAALHLLPNQWQEEPWLWRDRQEPHFLAEQLAWLESALAARPDLAQVVCTHSPVHAAAPAHTGLSEPIHPSTPGFIATFAALRRRHPTLRAVLGGHNHLVTRTSADGVDYLTSPSFVEAPFEFRAIAIDARGMSVRTVALAGRVRFPFVYDPTKAWVQGPSMARDFRREW